MGETFLFEIFTFSLDTQRERNFELETE